MSKTKILLYCTKGKPYLTKDYDMFGDFVKFKTTNDLTNYQTLNGILEYLNGKIVCECECDKVEGFDVPYPAYFSEVNDKLEHITNGSCLSLMNLHHYLGTEKGYALHLSNVKVFDKPKELSEYLIFNGDNTNIENWKPNKHAPQNMKVVYEFCEYNEGILLLPKRTLNKCILISIQPQHLCKILNGEKTIEVRKQILNCLKEKM